MAPESSGRLNLTHAIRDAAIAALIAAGLFLPLVAFNTVQNIHNELILETRWPLFGALVAIIAGGRFLHSLLIVPWLEQRSIRPHRERTRVGHLTNRMVPLTLVLAQVVYVQRESRESHVGFGA